MRNQTPVLGIITNDRNSVFQRDIITGMEQVAETRGYEVFVDSIAEDPAHPQPLSLDIRSISGALVISNVLSDAALHELYNTGKPLSLVSHRVPDLPIPAVIPNNMAGMARMVEYLVLECSRHKPVFIRGDMAQNDGLQRDYVFRQELMRYNVPISDDYLLRGDFIPAAAADSLRVLLTHTRDFDSVVASDYLMGVAALDVLREAGVNVPDEVAVLGFGDGAEAAAAGLTTVAADVVELGRRAARQLIGQVEGLRIRGVTIMSVDLVERETSKRI